MLIYASDLNRLIRAAGMSKREFLRRVELRNPDLAYKLRCRLGVFEIATAGELLALRDALKLKASQITRENKKRRRLRLPKDGLDALSSVVKNEGLRLGEDPLHNLKTALKLAVDNYYLNRLVWLVTRHLELFENRVKVVGSMLAQWRKELGVTQSELARRTCLKREVISLLERGQFQATTPAGERAWSRKVDRVAKALERIEALRADQGGGKISKARKT